MSETVDVFWSFRSPYSYLVTPDLLKLRADYDVCLLYTSDAADDVSTV